MGVPPNTMLVSGAVWEACAVGCTVLLVPEEGKVSFDEVADILGCAPTFLEKLVKDGEIPPAAWDERHPRRSTFLGKDILAYREKRKAQAAYALPELPEDLRDVGVYR
jgi:hypothetical protein